MIPLKQIIELLASNDWYIDDEDIKIAKGKYQSPTNWKQLRETIKRR
jgi:hypothetical protein|tara:strand:+ start:72 stop:212 length:141 start_codon:yes stop_codon:yes gene_type:complete